MAKEPSEVSLHKLKGCREKTASKRTNKYLFTTCPSDNYLYTESQKVGLKIYYLKNTPGPTTMVIEWWSPKTKICTGLVIYDGRSVSSKIS